MKRKAVLLITGQKKRLELLSKIKYIITPNNKSYDFVVVLSLADTNNFTNKHKYKEHFNFLECDIEKELSSISHYINNISYPTLKLNDEIVSMYDKKSFGEEFKEKRAYNHIRQYYTLSGDV